MSMQQPHPTDVRKAMDYYNRGASFLNLGRCEEALAALNQAIALDPSDAESYFGRGRTLRVLKRYEEALIALNQAIALDPSHTEAYGGLGTCLEILGRHKEALAAFEQARRLNPNLAVQQYASKRRRDARNAARFPVTRAGIHKINDLLYFVSPVTCLGRHRQRKRTCQRRSSMGWFSITSAGVTRAARMIRCFPPIDHVMRLIAKVKWSPTMPHRSSIQVSGAYPPVGAAEISPSHLALLLAAFGIPIMASFLLFWRQEKLAGRWVADQFRWPPGQVLLFAAHPPAGKASPLRLTQVGFLETVGCL
jgi:Tetratricopeptide repeat